MAPKAGSVWGNQKLGQDILMSKSAEENISPSGEVCVHHEGRAIRVADNLESHTTHNKDLEGRPKKSVKSKLCRERKICALVSPVEDYERIAGCTKQDLLARITFDRNGMQSLKKYVDQLDEIDNKGGGSSNEDLNKFCKDVRESALEIFRDYMKEFKYERAAENGILYLLKRLNRYGELEMHCKYLLRQSRGVNIRAEHIELALIEALIKLGRIDEAKVKFECAKSKWGNTPSVIDSCVKIYVSTNDFKGAHDFLDGALSDGLIKTGFYKNRKRFVDGRFHELKIKECSITEEGSKPESHMESFLEDYQCTPPSDHSLLMTRMSHREMEVGSFVKRGGFSDPEKDFHANVRVTKEYLQEVMGSWDDKGLEILNNYFKSLDRKMGGSTRPYSDIDLNRIRQFCFDARKSGLSLIDDYILENGEDIKVCCSKIFLLNRLKRFSEILSFYNSCRVFSKKRVLNVELKVIDSLSQVNRFDEAWAQMDKTRNYFGEEVVGLSIVTLYVMQGAFSKAKSYLEDMRSKNLVDERRYSNSLKWIDACSSESSGSVDLKFEKSNSYLAEPIYTLDDFDESLFQAAERNFDEKFYAIAITLLSIIKNKHEGVNECVDSLYKKCDDKKGICKKINLENL